MHFTKSTPIPSVKAGNQTEPPSTVYFEGYLNKQKHGKCKAWLKRYFVLYGEELRYYKTKNDTSPLAVISLDHYSLVPDAQPLTSLNSKQWRFNTFCLVSDDETKYDWPDYFLQAPSEEEREIWIESLQKYVAQSTSVLEKWLGRVDLPNQDDASIISSSIQELNNRISYTKSISLHSQAPSFDSLQKQPSNVTANQMLSNSSFVSSNISMTIQNDDINRKAVEVPIINPNDFDKNFTTEHYYYAS